MLVLLFEVLDGRYALPTDQVVEIIPVVKMKKVPRAPQCVAGIINYRGTPLPVIDLGILIEGNPCAQRLSTRIILVYYPFRSERKHLLGLIAERVTETVKINHDSLPPSGILMDEELYVGALGDTDEEMVRCFDIQRLVPESIVETLFQD